jgi:hypothetical protein
MAADRTIVFKLNGKRPEELTIERLALYLRTLGELVGSNTSVRAKAIVGGSVEISLTVNRDYYPALVERLTTAQNPDRAAATVAKTVRQLEVMITEDCVTAEARAGRTKLFHLRGYAAEFGQAVGPIVQRHSVRGEIIGLEGKDATKHARIAEFGSAREVHGDFRDDAIAEKLLHYLWKGVVEISGTARWFRHADGYWELKAFHIDDAQAVADSRPSDFVRELREAFTGAETPTDLVKTSRTVRG